MLVRFYKRLQKNGIQILSDGLVNQEIIDLFKVNQMWDLINTLDSGIQLNVVENNNRVITIDKKTSAYTLASLEGRLDANRVTKMNFSEVIPQFGEAYVILNLTRLEFLDSTGLRLFFYLQKELKKQNKKLFLMNPNSSVNQLLTITNLIGFFNVIPELKSVDEILINESV